jgi:pimeloyl-ACP methyl ester carboxylesterase
VPPGRHVELPGRGVTFVREVAGPPGAVTVLLLHGLAGTAGVNFAPAYEQLAQHFRVVALDHRGHGRGIRAPARFRLEDCADDAVALADELGIERFIPVGYSMGGPIAQLVWRRHRQRVTGLVLCATSRNFQGYWHERIRFAGLGLLVAGLNVLPRRVASEIATQLPDELVAGDGRWVLGELRRHDPRSMLEAAEAVGTFTSRAWISEIDVPVSVVVTSGDRVVPVHRQAKLAMAIPTAVVHVADIAHMGPSAAPDRFAAALVEASLQVQHRAAKRSAEEAS